MVDTLVYIAEHDVREVGREAVWCLSNATALRDIDVTNNLAERGILKILGEQAEIQDCSTQIVILEALSNIFKVGSQVFEANENYYCDQFEQFGALDTLEKLQESENQYIYELALKILETYFILEDVDLSQITEDYMML